jgi:hypothetical protein
MSYTVIWELPSGFYARVTDWVTPELAARLSHELTSDPRYDDLRYAIIDLTGSPGHTFRRGDRMGISAAMVEMIGARFTNPRVIEVAIATDPRMLSYLATYARFAKGPFEVFPTLTEARNWLSEQTVSLRSLKIDVPPG